MSHTGFVLGRNCAARINNPLPSHNLELCNTRQQEVEYLPAGSPGVAASHCTSSGNPQWWGRGPATPPHTWLSHCPGTPPAPPWSAGGTACIVCRGEERRWASCGNYWDVGFLGQMHVLSIECQSYYTDYQKKLMKTKLMWWKWTCNREESLLSDFHLI